MPLESRIVREVQHHILSRLNHKTRLTSYFEIHIRQIRSLQDFFYFTRVCFGLDPPPYKSQEKEDYTHNSKGRRKREARIEPGVSPMDDHPNDEEVVEQVGVRKELPLLVPYAGER